MCITRVMEHKEVVLDSIIRILCIPWLISGLFPNSNHGPYCTNPFEDLTKLLSKKMIKVEVPCGLCKEVKMESASLKCPICEEYFHQSCLGIDEPLDIQLLVCEKCEIKWGQTIQSSSNRLSFLRTSPEEDCQDFIKEFIDREFLSSNELQVKTFSGLKEDTLTVQYLNENGFTVPIIVLTKEHLGMKVPEEVTSKFLMDRLDGLNQITVTNVLGQKNGTMYLHEFQDYFEAGRRKHVLCSLSLELSRTKLKSDFTAPKVVRSIDWSVLFHQSGEYKDYTERFLQHFMAGSFINFHIDGGGSSIWHHICEGKELIYLLKPTDDGSDAIQQYADWVASYSNDSRSRSFFEHSNQPLRCYRIEVAEGQTIFVPGGFIRASFYPEKTVVLGGNFLSLYNVETQLRCFHMEETLGMASEYRFPGFKELHWRVARRLSDSTSDENNLRLRENLILLYNELQRWDNVERENGSSAGCSYSSNDISTISILGDLKSYINLCDKDDEDELGDKRGPAFQGDSTDTGSEPSGSGGPVEVTASGTAAGMGIREFEGIAASSRQVPPRVDPADDLSDTDDGFPLSN